MMYRDLSDEQKLFVEYALKGYSIHVEACIGSGKTTAIQMLCDCIPVTKKVLYLTYNTLLKQDAKARIKGPNIDVTNYHGFAYRELMRSGVVTTQQDCVRDYNIRKPVPRHYDILMLDEYQDIDQDIADLLIYLRDSLPGLQIIVVGDMAQKIYDKTRLRVDEFMEKYLAGRALKLEFTQCFRLSAGLASHLGHVWGKKIVGVNQDCEVKYMDFTHALNLLITKNPGEILCLGSNTGMRTVMLNRLEQECPEKFNKNTCWSKITTKDGGATQPGPGTAIFTTYDGCKGMERDICVVFDWTDTYWFARNKKPEANYNILRNLFCVAASRGKKKIIFITGNNSGQDLQWRTLMTPIGGPGSFKDMNISTMFDFKYEEDVDDAYLALDRRQLAAPCEEISVKNADGLIDLAPCIGTYQEAMFFRGYDIDEAVKFYFERNGDMEYKRATVENYDSWGLEQKVLYLTSLETNQHRYWYQVALPLVPDVQKQRIRDRLSSVFTGDESVQGSCMLPFCSDGVPLFSAVGQYDVVVGDTVWELKFVSELAHVHFLQCAMYMIAMNKPCGVLFNVRTGEMVEIRISDRQAFMNKAIRAATKSRYQVYDTATAALMAPAGVTGWRDQFVTAKPAALPQPQKATSAFEVQKQAVQKPGKSGKRSRRKIVRASEYPGITNEFLRENEKVAAEVISAVQTMEQAGRKPTPRQLEDMFSLRGAELPLPCTAFSICFWDVYRVMTGGGKK